MATHSSILAWKIAWTEEPGGLQSMGSQRVGHDLTTEQQRRQLISHLWGDIFILCKHLLPHQISLTCFGTH